MADEKAEEKREEKEEKQEEKTMEEKWRRDPLGAIVWAGILIWAGLVFLANNLGLLDQIRLAPLAPGWELGPFQPWRLISLGAGVILVLEVVVRMLAPAYRRPVLGTLILAVVFIGIGLGSAANWSLLWPAILIAVGLSILLRGLMRRSG